MPLILHVLHYSCISASAASRQKNGNAEAITASCPRLSSIKQNQLPGGAGDAKSAGYDSVATAAAIGQSL
ncbi:hypothetical protein J6590_017347 [Homalodisca vitripennis]|nr:hypothetical protein J6590_017347 [Homalodisca vitripennis]